MTRREVGAGGWLLDDRLGSAKATGPSHAPLAETGSVKGPAPSQVHRIQWINKRRTIAKEVGKAVRGIPIVGHLPSRRRDDIPQQESPRALSVISQDDTPLAVA